MISIRVPLVRSDSNDDRKIKTKRAYILMKRFDLTYFRNGIGKRFSSFSMVDIDIAIEEALEQMKPSRDRARLKRLVVNSLSKRGQAKVAGIGEK